MDKLQEVASSKDQAELKLEESHAQLQESWNQYQQLDKEFQNAQAHIQKLEADNETLLSQLQQEQEHNATSELDLRLRGLQDSYESLNALHENLLLKNKELEDEVGRLNFAMTKMQNDYDEMIKEIQFEQAKVEEERDTLLEQVKDSSNYASILEEKNILVSENEKLKQEHDILQQQIQEVSMELEQFREKYHREIHDLQTQYDDAQTWGTMVSSERDRLANELNLMKESSNDYLVLFLNR